MGQAGENLIAASRFAPFFNVTDADTVGIDAPESRNDDALRAAVRPDQTLSRQSEWPRDPRTQKSTGGAGSLLRTSLRLFSLFNRENTGNFCRFGDLKHPSAHLTCC